MAGCAVVRTFHEHILVMSDDFLFLPTTLFKTVLFGDSTQALEAQEYLTLNSALMVTRDFSAVKTKLDYRFDLNVKGKNLKFITENMWNNLVQNDS